jgi:hypothetical protein
MPWWRLGRALCLTVAVALPVAAQSVDPPFAVHQGRARSSVLITNPSLQPLAFVIEPLTFDIAACGDLGLAPIDTARIRLSLSAMSGRIPAKQTRRIFYEARADSLPAWFALKIAFGPARRDSGMAMRLEMTHFVYLMQEAPVLPEEIVASEARFDPVRNRLTIRVENRGPKLTRLHSVGLVDADGEERAVEACPLLPHHARDFDFPWSAPLPPRSVRLRFPGFVIERPVRPPSLVPDATRTGPPPTAAR